MMERTIGQKKSIKFSGQPRAVPLMTSSSTSLITPTPFGHGQRTLRLPTISPTRHTSRESLYRLRTHPRTFTERAKEIMAPNPKTNNSFRLLSLIASITGAYMPIVNNKNEPDIPGRTIAQIAIKPPTKKLNSDGFCVWPELKPRIKNVATATRTMQTNLRELHAATILTPVCIEIATSPKKSPAIGLG